MASRDALHPRLPSPRSPAQRLDVMATLQATAAGIRPRQGDEGGEFAPVCAREGTRAPLGGAHGTPHRVAELGGGVETDDPRLAALPRTSAGPCLRPSCFRAALPLPRRRAWAPRPWGLDACTSRALRSDLGLRLVLPEGVARLAARLVARKPQRLDRPASIDREGTHAGRACRRRPSAPPGRIRASQSTAEKLHDLTAPSRQSSSSYLPALYPTRHLAYCPLMCSIAPAPRKSPLGGHRGPQPRAPCRALRAAEPVPQAVARAAPRGSARSTPGHIAFVLASVTRPASHRVKAALHHRGVASRRPCRRGTAGARAATAPTAPRTRPPGAGRERRGVYPQGLPLAASPGLSPAAPREGDRLAHAGHPRHSTRSTPGVGARAMRPPRAGAWPTWPPATGRAPPAQEFVGGCRVSQGAEARGARDLSGAALGLHGSASWAGSTTATAAGETPSLRMRRGAGHGSCASRAWWIARPRRGRARGRGLVVVLRGAGHVVRVDHRPPLERG